MPGPRRDKADAWFSLLNVLQTEAAVLKSVLSPFLGDQLARGKSDVLHCYEMLKSSGRLTAAQIKGISQLVKAVIRLKNVGRQ